MAWEQRRFLIITPYYPPGLGGACRLLGLIGESMAARAANDGVEGVDVVTYGAPLYSNTAAHDADAPVTVHRIPATWQSTKTTLAMGRRIADLLRRSRYPLVFSGTAYPSSLLARAATLVTRTPYIVYSHGEDVTVVRSGPARWMLRRSLRGAAHVFANSSFTRDALVAAGADPTRLDVLHPGIATDALLRADDAMAEALRERLGVGSGPLLLTVARLQERKGHDTVLRALPEIARTIPGVRYLVVGAGDETKLRSLASSLGVTDRLTIVHGLSDDELAAAYAACDVYVMVSRTEADEVEGFGMVYLEAGAAGRPCVCGDKGGAPEAVIDGVTGIVVDAASAEATAAAVLSLLRDPERRSAMGAAARARALRDFGDDAFVRRVDDRITDVLARARR